MSAVKKLLKKLRPKAPFEELPAIWHEHDPKTWRRNLELYQRLGHQFVKQDEPLLKLDVLTAGLRHDTGAPGHRDLAWPNA